jgi:hypothetical protein
MKYSSLNTFFLISGQSLGSQLHEGSQGDEHQDLSHLVQRHPSRRKHLRLCTSKLGRFVGKVINFNLVFDDLSNLN